MTDENLENSVRAHYAQPGLFEEIKRRLLAMDIDGKDLIRTDLSGVDEFHVRGAAVSQELAETAKLHGQYVLDVGCGLGGPCRMLADLYKCVAVGLDLNPEYVETAQKLSAWVGLDHRTKFVTGNATSLPFGDAEFDVVWTQHVQMNIPDKDKLYYEMTRVLKPGGSFLYYDIFRNEPGDITYPMPWAGTAELSFLIRTRDMHTILADRGMEQVGASDQTTAGVAFFEQLLERINRLGPPELGLNVLMGPSTVTKLTHLMEHLKNSKLMLESGIYIKR